MVCGLDPIYGSHMLFFFFFPKIVNQVVCSLSIAIEMSSSLRIVVLEIVNDVNWQQCKTQKHLFIFSLFNNAFSVTKTI
jgi:hypothetical protein